MKGYDEAFKFVVGAEGGYVNDPDDPGGETKYGISKRSYPDINIESLTLDEAHEIYYTDYWKPMKCGLVAYPKALCLFDSAVNQGKRRATKFAQRAVATKDDGVMGSVTLSAMNRMKDSMFVEYFLQSRKAHYESLSTFGKFGKGWMNRLEHVRAEALSK